MSKTTDEVKYDIYGNFVDYGSKEEEEPKTPAPEEAELIDAGGTVETVPDIDLPTPIPKATPSKKQVNTAIAPLTFELLEEVEELSPADAKFNEITDGYEEKHVYDSTHPLSEMINQYTTEIDTLQEKLAKTTLTEEQRRLLESELRAYTLLREHADDTLNAIETSLIAGQLEPVKKYLSNDEYAKIKAKLTEYEDKINMTNLDNYETVFKNIEDEIENVYSSPTISNIDKAIAVLYHKNVRKFIIAQTIELKKLQK